MPEKNGKSKHMGDKLKTSSSPGLFFILAACSFFHVCLPCSTGWCNCYN